MSHRVRFAVIVAAAALALSGCGGSSGGSDSGQSPSTKATAAAGDTVTGTGYTFNAPKGWKPPPQKIPGFDTDAFVGDPDDDDGFTDNINVIRAATTETDIDALEKSSEQELKASHGTDVKVLDQQQIDGETAAHLTSGASRNGVGYLLDQFLVVHDGAAYAITFSFSDTVTASHQEEVAQSVVASWKWTG